MKLITSLSVFYLFSISAFCQADTLVALVNDDMIKVSETDAASLHHQSVSGLGGTYDIQRLTWSEMDSCFYTLSYFPASGSNSFGKLTYDGVFTDLGPVTVAGQTVHFLEAIAVNPNDGRIYVSASLNGSQPSDYWAETLINVNTVTMTGVVIGTFSHPGMPYEAEGDILAFDTNDNIYYNDTEGGSSPVKYFYKQDVNMTTSPVLVYQSNTANGTNGLTVRGDNLYYTYMRNLIKVDLGTSMATTVGPMFSASDHGGSLTKGLAWMNNEEVSRISSLESVQINVYPNPTRDIVEINAIGDKIQKVRLFNAIGQLLLEKDVNMMNTSIDLNSYESGTYTLELLINDKKETKSIVLTD